MHLICLLLLTFLVSQWVSPQVDLNLKSKKVNWQISFYSCLRISRFRMCSASSPSASGSAPAAADADSRFPPPPVGFAPAAAAATTALSPTRSGGASLTTAAAGGSAAAASLSDRRRREGGRMMWLKVSVSSLALKRKENESDYFHFA